MFFYIAKRLVGNEIINAVKLLRTRGISQRIKTDMFKDLRETFNPLIFKILGGVIKVSPFEKKEIQNFIEAEFFRVLVDKKLNLTDERRFKAYLKFTLGVRVNLESVRDYLGKSPIIKGVWNDERELKKGLKKYIKKYKRYPDFKNRNDIRDLAGLIGKKTDDVKEMLIALDPSTISSMYKEIGGSESDKNIKTLLDTLKNNKPLPDKIRHDHEIMELLMKIVNTLKPDERMIWKRYYNPEKLHSPKITKEELAKELSTKGWTYGKVRKTLDNANLKIRNHKLSDEIRYAEFKRSMIKYAMTTYDFVEKDNEQILINVNKLILSNKENIVNDILKSYKH